MNKEFFGGSLSASKGEFNDIALIMDDQSQSLDYFQTDKSMKANNQGMFYQNLAGTDGTPYYDSRVTTTDDDNFIVIPGSYVGPHGDEDTSPADLSVIPTSTTNPERPRTVAAGYDADEEKLTVVFRDGTFYNYYEVDKAEWKAFKANASKGAYIYSYLDFKPRGVADITTLSQQSRAAFYRVSRGLQIHHQGKEKGQSSTKYKTAAQTNRAKNRKK